MISIPESLLQPVLNHLLAQEDWARAELKRHAGKIACFELGPMAVHLGIAGDGLLVAGSQGQAAAVTIRMRAADLPLLVQQRDRIFSYVQIEGDADFANTISQVGRSLRWEVADDLSKLVGDLAAQRIVSSASGAIVTLRTTQQSIMENVAEYFLEEKQMLVRPAAVENFTHDVIRVRDDVERLVKRIERLERRI